MNDIERAIETLKDMKGVFDIRGHKQYSLSALDLAIAALEKQIAEKIEKDIVIDGDYGGNNYEREIPVCPSCNYIYLMLKQPHCNQCGQKIDWSVEE